MAVIPKQINAVVLLICPNTYVIIKYTTWQICYISQILQEHDHIISQLRNTHLGDVETTESGIQILISSDSPFKPFLYFHVSVEAVPEYSCFECT